MKTIFVLSKKMFYFVTISLIVFVCNYNVFPEDQVLPVNTNGEQRNEKKENMSVAFSKELFDFRADFPKFPPYPSVDTINKVDEDMRQRFLSIDNIIKKINVFDIKQQIKYSNWESNRKELGKICLLLVYCMNAAIDPHFDFDVVVSNNVSIPTHKLPPGTFFSSGMSPDGIKDAEFRKAYEEALWKNHQLSWEMQVQSYLRERVPNVQTIVHFYFISAYAQLPKANTELVDLLEKYNYPEEEKIKVLKALKIPYQSFREWQSQDGKFKITAKFVSFDGQNVILEDKDKKREIVTFSSLRKEDQKYVKEQVKGEK